MLNEIKKPIEIIILLIFAGCTSTAHKAKNYETSNEPKTTSASTTTGSDDERINSSVAHEAKAHDFVEIEFNPGSATLTESAKSSLDSIIEQAKNSGKIDEVLVLSWADEEFPSKETKKLSKAQRDLADARNEAIKKYIKSGRSVDVDTYSMAKQPNPLARWFNTTDNKLKNSFTAAGLPTSADSTQHPSKASHAVIFVKVE